MVCHPISKPSSDMFIPFSMVPVLKNLMLGVVPLQTTSTPSIPIISSILMAFTGKSSENEVANRIGKLFHQSSSLKQITYVASFLDLVKEFWNFLLNSFSSSFISPSSVNPKLHPVDSLYTRPDYILISSNNKIVQGWTE